MKMSENIGKILWGLLFLVGAVYLIASKVWSLPRISVFNVILGVFCVWIMIEGIRHVNFWEILFPIAFICILFSAPLGLSAFTPWPVLGAALLGSIGLSMIFKPKKHRTWSEGHMYGNMAGSNSEQCNGENLNFDNTFGESIKYINTDNLCTVSVDTVSDQPAYTSTMRSFRARVHRYISIIVSVRSASTFRALGMWMSMWKKRSEASICVDEWKARAHIVCL